MDIEEQHQFQNCLGNFLTLEGEKLLFARRKHVRILFAPIIISIFLFLLCSALSFFLVKTFLPNHLLLSFAVALVLLLITISAITKIVVDWFFHLYIITNRKVLEVRYKPFYSKDIYVVSLDQVRCVEISAREQGILKALVGVGDVVCHFDLLTHQDTFVMSNIGSPETFGILVGDVLNSLISSRSSSPVNPFPMTQEEYNWSSPPPSQTVYTHRYAFRTGG